MSEPLWIDRARGTLGRWSLPGVELVTEVYPPYEGDGTEGDAAEAIVGSDLNLILLERLGYNLSLKKGLEDVVQEALSS